MSILSITKNINIISQAQADKLEWYSRC